MAQWRRHSSDFKFRVALETTKGIQLLNESVKEYQLHPRQVSGGNDDAGKELNCSMGFQKCCLGFSFVHSIDRKTSQ